MAALSRQSAVGGKYTVTPSAPARRVNSARSAEFAATPPPTSIHEIGITPDIEVKFRIPDIAREEKDKDDVEKIFNDVEIQETKDPEEIEKAQKETEVAERLKNDNQVQSAIRVIKGIKVFKNAATAR